MFVDMSFFEVDEEYCEQFERIYGRITSNANAAEGCLSSELFRLTEERRYCWVERLVDRDAHQQFNEFLFGDIIPGLPAELNDHVVRLDSRDAEGFQVDLPNEGL